MGRARKNRMLREQPDIILDWQLKQTWEGFKKMTDELDALLHIEGCTRGRFYYALSLLSGSIGRCQNLLNTLEKKKARAMLQMLEEHEKAA